MNGPAVFPGNITQKLFLFYHGHLGVHQDHSVLFNSWDHSYKVTLLISGPQIKLSLAKHNIYEITASI